jgi:hypothetical protein
MRDYWQQWLDFQLKHPINTIHHQPWSGTVMNIFANDMYEIAVEARTVQLFRISGNLAEMNQAYASVRDACRRLIKLPWEENVSLEGSLIASVYAMRLDNREAYTHLSGLSDAALYLLRHSLISLPSLRGIMAAKAATNDSYFFIRLAEALRQIHCSPSTPRLSPILMRCWLPLGLWLMDDPG